MLNIVKRIKNIKEILNCFSYIAQRYHKRCRTEVYYLVLVLYSNDEQQ